MLSEVFLFKARLSVQSHTGAKLSNQYVLHRVSFDIECHKALVGSFYGRYVMNIHQMFRKKNNVSFKSESSYRQKNLSKTPVSIFVFVSLLIAAYFLLKLIMEGIESNAGSSYG